MKAREGEQKQEAGLRRVGRGGPEGRKDRG